ncbi:metal-dependent hydrolase [Halapricum salinum]|uniref:Metal-dependent hydrolase n=1 Tax=Halapricum salinum TaxID=1457250 RepID=A0A4D6HGD0_9EURY|nr:metal-dependent hydrolase [Halapricum salinum]QCC52860.1 metal-dependent hydrolase [Halapricum salinum]
MWPWGHLALGYVLYSLGRRAGRRAPPTDQQTLALALGTQLPDLIDKPLAWWVPILPGGRTLGHSLVFAVPLVLVLGWVAHRRGRRSWVVAFAVGYASHLAGDLYLAVAWGNYYELNILLWPLTPTVLYDAQPSVLWHLSSITLTPLFLAELALGAFVVALWLADGRPGIGSVRRLLRRAGPTPSK